MDTALAGALAPVLHDLRTSGSVLPEVRDQQWDGIEGQATAYLYSPDGSGQGVFVMTGEPLPQQIASVADQVQEWAVEELCSVGRATNWPPCPQHPGSHPLSPVAQGSQAVWTCPATGLAISEIGQLGPGPRPAPGATGRPGR
ncbi:MAG TPA: hypothetical protein VIZ00_13665 [Streptosporangiaceae bacterium]